jgi:tetratricopeptide (TPR) repeat protein
MIDPAAPSRTTTLHDQLCSAVRALRDGVPDARFALRRAEALVAETPGPLGAALAALLKRAREPLEERSLWSESVAGALVRAGGAFEQARDHAAARALFELATELRPECAATTLHAGRAARRAGDREGALAHYTRAQALDEGGRVARLARIGEAMLSRAGERRLSEEIRDAVRAGDREAAGVGLEARAIVRCETARCREAIRDLCVCALRYPDREDQARAAERVAELLIQSNDLEAAREALLLVHEIGTPAQRVHARAQLHALSAKMGDVLGTKRWRGAGISGATVDPLGPPTDIERAQSRLESSAGGGAAPPSERKRIALPMIRGWRDAVERTAGAR